MANWRRILCALVLTFLAGSMAVARAAGEDEEEEDGPRPQFPFKWIRIHGWLMWLGMGLLMPVAIILVRFAKQARERGDLKTVRNLVYAHIALQMLAVLAVICSAVVGVLKFDNGFIYTHERLGLALWILVWVAPLLGFIRPQHGMRSRPVWFAAHWLTGTGAVLLGFYNIYSGLNAYEHMNRTSLRTLNILFSIQLGLVATVYLAQDRWDYLKDQGKGKSSVGHGSMDDEPSMKKMRTTTTTSNGVTTAAAAAMTARSDDAHIQITPN